MSFSFASAFLSPLTPSARRPRGGRRRGTCDVRMTSSVPPTAARVLRLERALAAAVEQERYTDAASLRDALAAARTSDPLLAKRAELAAAVSAEDFVTAARVRDEVAALTERCSRGEEERQVDRIVVLRGRAEPAETLRVATVSPEGDLALALLPPADDGERAPRVFLQPTWSPSGDFVAMTEIAFHVDVARAARGIAVAETSSRLVVMNTFDGTVVRSVPLRKPPFFYLWSPDGRSVTMLSNDPTSSITTVVLSALQVVVPPGGAGLDTETVTGPLASGHPFLYDFCPRDASRVVAHMGDCDTVAIIPVNAVNQKRRVLTSAAGAFGTPQWHPLVGRDGREVVLFVESDPAATDLTAKKGSDDNDENSAGNIDLEAGADNDADGTFEKFISNGTTLLESVLRKGAESLGLVAPKDAKEANETTSTESASSESKPGSVADKLQALEEKLRRLIPKQREIDENSESGDAGWGNSSTSDKVVNRLVMCDIDRPELRRTIARFSGVMAFKLSPNGSTLATLVTNPVSGDDELTLCTGDFSPDSVVSDEEQRFRFGRPFSSSRCADADIILSTPATRVLAFFWSPDSRKLLYLCSLRDSNIGAAQWATFDIDTSKVTRYEKFVMSGIYIHTLNFFDQFAMSMTPWSPDSNSFCYPGRPLTAAELERDDDMSAGNSPALSAIFVQKDGSSEDKRFVARVQKVADTSGGKATPEPAITIVDNVEYACWSPC